LKTQSLELTHIATGTARRAVLGYPINRADGGMTALMFPFGSLASLSDDPEVSHRPADQVVEDFGA
jgi:hypothetical protein